MSSDKPAILKQGDFIKSDKFMDVCLEIHDVEDYPSGIVVWASWVNMGQSGRGFRMGMDIRINFAKTQSEVNRIRPVCLDSWKVRRGIPLGAVPRNLRNDNWSAIV